MADISSIKLPSGTTYTVKDSTARTHISNKSNPHGVTKAQVGLGSVANYDQSKAIKSITRSGTTFTATALDGTTFTFTQNANEVNVDTALSATSTNPVQNKVIKAALDGKANSSHGTHVPSTCTIISDWDNVTSNGWYMALGATNGPVADTWFMGYVLVHNSIYVIQELYGFTSSTNAYSIPKYMRVKLNGVWGDWRNVTVSKQVPSDAKFTDTVYSHPSTHPATMISTDASHRFVSDSEKSAWNSKAAGNHTHNLSELINNLSTDTSNPKDADYFVSQYAGGGTSKTSYYRRPISTIWNYIKSKADSVYQAKGSYASTAVATQSANGLMSAADKTKLDSLSTISVSAITNSEIDTIVAS